MSSTDKLPWAPMGKDMGAHGQGYGWGHETNIEWGDVHEKIKKNHGTGHPIQEPMGARVIKQVE